MFGVTAIVAWIIPDVPKKVANQAKRENFPAREALRSADQYNTGSLEPPEDHRGRMICYKTHCHGWKYFVLSVFGH